jgi:hypothetical protein
MVVYLLILSIFLTIIYGLYIILKMYFASGNQYLARKYPSNYLTWKTPRSYCTIPLKFSIRRAMIHHASKDAKKEHREERITKQERSGLNAKAFCAQKKILLATFYWWKSTLKEKDTQRDAAGFVEKSYARTKFL